MRLPVSTPLGLEPSQVAVFGRVIGDFVLPAAPENSQPGTAENPDRMRVLEAARTGIEIDASRPGMGMARGVSQAGDGVSQSLVTGPAKAGDLALARLPRHRRHAGVGCERLLGRVAPSVVADLGDQTRR